MINLQEAQKHGTRVVGDGKKLHPANLDPTLGTLSERESQIAVLVSRGKGTKQIAGNLHISEHTVRSYMRRIFAKLGVSNRPAMVAQLLQTRTHSLDPEVVYVKREDCGAGQQRGEV